MYSYDNGGTVFRVNGCDYSLIRYAPCVPDELESTSIVKLSTITDCSDCPEKSANPSGFQTCVKNFEDARKTNLADVGVAGAQVVVTSICGDSVEGTGRMLARDTTNRRLDDGNDSVIYDVTAKQKCECGDSCTSQDVIACEAASQNSISGAEKETQTISAVSSSVYASTG